MPATTVPSSSSPTSAAPAAAPDGAAPACPRPLALALLAGFGALSLMALAQHGYWGLIAPLLPTWGGWQVLLDLALALGLASVALWRDARARGRNPWPWLLLTLAGGSLGLLLYWALRPAAARR